MNFEIHILAGGKSSRMGQDKGLMKFKGAPMIQHVIDTASTLNQPIRIITNNMAYQIFGLPLISDNFRGIGPIGGIQAGLMHSDSDNIMFLTCDIPYISAEVLDELSSAHAPNTVTIVEDAKGPHPLIGIYSKSCLPIIEEEIKQKNYRITNTLDKFVTRKINVESYPTYYFKNINSPKDL